MATLDVEVVTGERTVLSETGADFVSVPGGDGVLGVLPHHAPLISTLAAGELRIKKGATEHSIAVFGGFAEITREKVVILADTAERAEEIDIARAQAARKRAEDAVANAKDSVDLATAEAALSRAILRIRVAEARRQGQRA